MCNWCYVFQHNCRTQGKSAGCACMHGGACELLLAQVSCRTASTCLHGMTLRSPRSVTCMERFPLSHAGSTEPLSFGQQGKRVVLFTRVSLLCGSPCSSQAPPFHYSTACTGVTCRHRASARTGKAIASYARKSLNTTRPSDGLSPLMLACSIGDEDATRCVEGTTPGCYIYMYICL